MDRKEWAAKVLGEEKASLSLGSAPSLSFWETNSFPNKVLEGLYIGNANHAGNKRGLLELGITHVLSVQLGSIPPHAEVGRSPYSLTCQAFQV